MESTELTFDQLKVISGSKNLIDIAATQRLSPGSCASLTPPKGPITLPKERFFCPKGDMLKKPVWCG
ncbi:hypothetical protein [Prochlorococcus marinus]|uniref:hypothetical protein n=1 Tax=Prochlorococcus marinus TaxID=1219 RepID=UPI0007BB568E|nr:hypothetical protein [Prochlorococcus marinus]KZR78269.1 hypothetical protein PMIT1320_00119 [Prochlorococcus marinus str. MIT 1320]